MKLTCRMQQWFHQQFNTDHGNALS